MRLLFVIVHDYKWKKKITPHFILLSRYWVFKYSSDIMGMISMHKG